jgi:hypothetical protein
MDKDLYVPRDKVVGVFSLARTMQELNERGDLEKFVSNLPVRQDNGDSISGEALCELGEESLRLEPEYIQKAARFFSGLPNETFKVLNELGASPTSGLREIWLKGFCERYKETIFDYLNNETNPREPIKSLEGDPNPLDLHFYVGYTERDNRGRFKKLWHIGPRTFYSGIIHFGDSRDRESPISADITASAFTPTMLSLFSGPIRELTLQIPEVNSYSPAYHKEGEEGDYVTRGLKHYSVGDPY